MHMWTIRSVFYFESPGGPTLTCEGLELSDLVCVVLVAFCSGHSPCVLPDTRKAGRSK